MVATIEGFQCITFTLSVLAFVYRMVLSPLYAASQEGHTDIVVILIKGSADIHQGTTEVYIISDIFEISSVR